MSEPLTKDRYFRLISELNHSVDSPATLRQKYKKILTNDDRGPESRAVLTKRVPLATADQDVRIGAGANASSCT